jgi:hypothetical protein
MTRRNHFGCRHKAIQLLIGYKRLQERSCKVGRLRLRTFLVLGSPLINDVRAAHLICCSKKGSALAQKPALEQLSKELSA